MSFTARVKNELAHVMPERACCRLAECIALTRSSGALLIRDSRFGVRMATANAAVARKIIHLYKALFGLPLAILYKRSSLRRQNIYLMEVTDHPGAMIALQEMGIIDAGGQFRFGMKRLLVARSCCRRAYLRGYFLGNGSLAGPERQHHLEMYARYPEQARELKAMLESFQLRPRDQERSGRILIYLKDGEQIVNFLNVVGAHSALLHYENVRIYKEFKSRVNRLVNCETGNLGKTVEAAMQQRVDIRLIEDHLGLHRLPRALRELVELRLKYPEASLRELGEMMNPPVGKSGVNHRMRRLEEMAGRLRAAEAAARSVEEKAQDGGHPQGQHRVQAGADHRDQDEGGDE